MSEKEKMQSEELEKVAGGEFVKTTCYVCGKEITIHVADFPMDGFPAPICIECIAKQNETEKVSAEELGKVSGGLSDKEKKDLHDSFEEMIASKGYQDMTCQFCGKTFPYSKFLLANWSGIDRDGRHHYDISTCPECKKEHPFVSRFDFSVINKGNKSDN